MLSAVATAVPFIWLAWQLNASRLAGSFEVAVLAVLGLPAVALAVALARRRAGRHRGEQLRWDGGRWQLLDAKGHAWLVDSPRVEVDLGSWMLLRTRHGLDGAVAWLPVQRSDTPKSWHALRVALAQPVAHAGRPASNGGMA